MTRHFGWAGVSVVEAGLGMSLEGFAGSRRRAREALVASWSWGGGPPWERRAAGVVVVRMRTRMRCVVLAEGSSWSLESRFNASTQYWWSQLKEDDTKQLQKKTKSCCAQQKKEEMSRRSSFISPATTRTFSFSFLQQSFTSLRRGVMRPLSLLERSGWPEWTVHGGSRRRRRILVSIFFLQQALASFVASRCESCTVQWLRAQEPGDVAWLLGRYIPLVSYSLQGSQGCLQHLYFHIN